MMIRKILFFLILIPFLGTSQSTFWKSVDENTINRRANEVREIIPEKYHTLELNLPALKEHLASAPRENDSNRRSSSFLVDIPMPDGNMESFNVFNAPVMMEGISARYPNIRSFKGQGANDPTKIIRFDFGPQGFHASVRTRKGDIYIDPYALHQDRYYISYYTRDHLSDAYKDVLTCGVSRDLMTPEELEILHESIEYDTEDSRNPDAELIPLRVYKLALACTGEWGGVATRGTVEKCLADMNTSVNRLNMIFENEMAARLVLIDDNDKIIWVDPDNDPYQNPTVGHQLLNENDEAINGVVGVGAYDIGHVYTRNCSDVGGVAALGGVCGQRKANAVTCHYTNSIIGITVSVTSHEMGHQFAATHTFNHCNGNNESGGTAYEPGGGTTIMSYAGLCESNDVQDYNDDYFHVGSLEQMYFFTRNGGNGDGCTDKIDINNHEPEVWLDYENGFYIPISTPFELTGNATDEDGDPMTYNWEQLNTGPLTQLGNPVANGPSFRSMYPDENPSRVFPALNKIVNSSYDDSEVLPTYSRDFRFAFVARDNNVDGGTAVWEELRFSATADAGPFKVTYPDQFENFEVGTEIDLQWNVANTNEAPVSCDKVDIYMSTDGGYTYDLLLCEGVDNDGLETLVIPNIITTRARLKVKCANNIFFDISNKNFRILEPSEPTFYIEAQGKGIDVCLPDNAGFMFLTTAFNGFNESLKFEVASGLPDGAIATFEPENALPGDGVMLNLDLSNVTGYGNYIITVNASAMGVDTQSRTFFLNTTGTDFSSLATLTPENGALGQSSLPEFTWDTAIDAEEYVIEIATNPAFRPEDIVDSGTVTGGSFTPNIILEKGTVYYWRVKAVNICLEGAFTDIQAFSTEALTCSNFQSNDLPKNISTAGSITVSSNINVLSPGNVADVNVTLIKGNHDNFKDLVANLISPRGTQVNLWNKKCPQKKFFTIGFDDESPTALNCPSDVGTIYRPNASLSTFNTEEMQGTWELQINDVESGNGGKIEGFELEICSNVSLNPPYLVTNEVLGVNKGQGRFIDDAFLLTEDDNNGPQELIYTIVDYPVNGQLFYNGTLLSAGDQFSQEDLFSSGLKYVHDDSDTEQDNFTFTVIDGEGGWVAITQFDMEIGEGNVSSTDDNEEIGKSIRIFPNPSTGRFFIDILDNTWKGSQLEIFDIHGKRVMNDVIRSHNTVVQSDLMTSGLYIVRINNGDKIATKKIVVR